MKKIIRIIGAILFVLVIAVGALAIWQKDNIASVITSTKYSNNEIAQKIESNKNDVEKAIKNYTNDTIRDFTLEEEEQIRRGEITVQEVVSKILAESTSNNKTSSFDSNASIETDADNSSDNNLDNIINKHIAQMYTLKATYIGKLGELERRAISDYKSLPKENLGSKGQQSIITKYIGQVAALERECDGKVNQVLESLQKELAANNGDLKLVKVIRKAYEDEKVLKKSYYLNTYK